MNTKDYVDKVHHLLDNGSFYKKLDSNPTLANANEITSFIDYTLRKMYGYPRVFHTGSTKAFQGFPLVDPSFIVVYSYPS